MCLSFCSKYLKKHCNENINLFVLRIHFNKESIKKSIPYYSWDDKMFYKKYYILTRFLKVRIAIY